jgi:cytochrome oxidase Cu insertion factor (SCO1/SenC/PrrC family)
MAAHKDDDLEQLGQMSIPDLEVLNQDGEPIHFYSDLVQGKTVVINSIFTTCTTICPPMGANFAKLQKMLGDHIGQDVFLISLSVDPVVDTPPRLKAWAGKFGAGPGWTLVTGPKHDMDRLLKALKFFTPDKTDHSPTVLVGDESQGQWTRAYGLAPPSKLAEVIQSVLATRSEHP